ncbi:hypothetical protein METHB2_230033 [Candidatus Methylobacter favarea]|uniref:Uncharacterized protein n=1 Tax=Candidatus Methylobacter favarea TaxID=2707345 RepID=A0A8S0Y9Q8_9GAMM|nr:hypothetical protein [Candidatus Methylobacter favarea]CAA9890511.1 hypothetical protein METHB2_230033 [Candidatus Methylobacter favarea]
MTKWCLTGGQTPDVMPAIGLVDGILAGAPGADKAWEADSVLEKLEESQPKPSRAGAAYLTKLRFCRHSINMPRFHLKPNRV